MCQMRFKNKFIIGLLLINFMLVFTGKSILTLSQTSNTTKNTSVNSTNWTVGVEVGSTKTSRVAHCEGECESITPEGTLIRHEIIAINDSFVTYKRDFSLPSNPDYPFPQEYIGTFYIPREGFEGAPPGLPAMEHPLMTNNTIYLKEELAKQNITIVSETDADLEFHQEFVRNGLIIDWNATILKNTGWLIFFNLVKKYPSGLIYLNMTHILTGIDPSLAALSSTSIPPSTSQPEDLLQTILNVAGLFLFLNVIFLGLLFLHKRNNIEESQNKSLSLLFEPEHITFLRKLYHKLIIGLDRNRTFLMNDVALSSVKESRTLSTDSSKVIVKLFPPDIRNDLTGDIKGRSVLILIELAFQGPENRFQGFLVKNLKIPQQTVASELKRLIDLEYVREFKSTDTLLDTRYKYYELTHKGLLFLHILKEVITNSLIQYQSYS